MCWARERVQKVATLGEELDHPVGEVAAGEVEAEDRVRERVALVDRDGVRDAVAESMTMPVVRPDA